VTGHDLLALPVLMLVLGLGAYGGWLLLVRADGRTLFARRPSAGGTAETAETDGANGSAGPVATAAWRGRERLRGSAVGRRARRRIDEAGVQYSVEAVVGASAGAAVSAALVLSRAGAVPALLGAAAASWMPFNLLRWRAKKRRETLVSQLPELARALANGAAAGLALPSAITRAAEEVAEPIRAEIRQTADDFAFGRSLKSCLLALEQRLPSAEASVMIRAVIISAESGGSTVTALRDIAVVMEERQELRREVRTTLSGVKATGNAVAFIGAALIAVLAIGKPALLARMLGSGPGLVATTVSVGLFLAGIALIRKMTRIPV